MIHVPIVCGDPLHATRATAPGWSDRLGTAELADDREAAVMTERLASSGLCDACATAAAEAHRVRLEAATKGPPR